MTISAVLYQLGPTHYKHHKIWRYLVNFISESQNYLTFRALQSAEPPRPLTNLLEFGDTLHKI